MLEQTIPSAPKTTSSGIDFGGVVNKAGDSLQDLWDSLMSGKTKVSIGSDQTTIQVGGISYTKNSDGTEVRMNNGDLSGVNGANTLSNSPFNILGDDNTAVIMLFVAGAVVLFLVTRR